MIIKMKRIFVVVSLIFTLIGNSYAELDEQQKNNDEFVQKFISMLKDSSAIKYGDGKLKLWARLSDKQRREFLVMDLCCLIPSLALMGASIGVDIKSSKRGLLALSASFWLFAVLFHLIWELNARDEMVPYPMLEIDAEGMQRRGREKITWEAIVKTLLKRLVFYNQYGYQVDETFKLWLLDSNDNEKIMFSDYDKIPMALVDFQVLVDYYIENSKKMKKSRDNTIAAH